MVSSKTYHEEIHVWCILCGNILVQYRHFASSTFVYHLDVQVLNSILHHSAIQMNDTIERKLSKKPYKSNANNYLNIILFVGVFYEFDAGHFFNFLQSIYNGFIFFFRMIRAKCIRYDFVGPMKTSYSQTIPFIASKLIQLQFIQYYVTFKIITKFANYSN